MENFGSNSIEKITPIDSLLEKTEKQTDHTLISIAKLKNLFENLSKNPDNIKEINK
jgi:hypothetical protein